MPSRNIEAARQSYLKGDVKGSRAAHNENCEPGHLKGVTELRKEALYGGFRGIITATVLLSALSATQLPSSSVVGISASCIIALALASALSSFVRAKADLDFYTRERAREQWELSNFKEGEIQEMEELYMEKGLDASDAKLVIQTISKYEPFFLELMMTQELKIFEPDSVPINFAMAAFFSSFAPGLASIGIYYLAIGAGLSDILPIMPVATIPEISISPWTLFVAVLTSGSVAIAKHKLIPHSQDSVAHHFIIFVASFLAAIIARSSTIHLLS